MKASDIAKDETRQSFLTSLSAFFALVFSLTVRDLRTENRSAALGILMTTGLVLTTALCFYFFTQLLGGRNAPIRTDGLTFTVVGFLLFFFHIRTAIAVAGALQPGLMRHPKATPFLFICVRAFATLYRMSIAMIILGLINYLLRDFWEMQNGLVLLLVLFTAWIGGVGVGMIMLAINRYFVWGNLVQTIYFRISFFTSGKFFVAGHIPNWMHSAMDWNPLFHLLDQARGAIFLNYAATTTSLLYAIGIYYALLCIGFMVEHYVRSTFSVSHAPLGSG